MLAGEWTAVQIARMAAVVVGGRGMVAVVEVRRDVRRKDGDWFEGGSDGQRRYRKLLRPEVSRGFVLPAPFTAQIGRAHV